LLNTIFGTLSVVPSAPVGVAGYFCGGYDGTYLSGIDKITFPADTKSTLSATLTGGIAEFSGFANSGVAGYVGGGVAPATDRIDKITFPADTKSTLSATLSSATQSMATYANSGTAGYFAGGLSGSFLSRIDKITFPADTKSTIAATLTSIRGYLAGMVCISQV
jgi:hypothetical protein